MKTITKLRNQTYKEAVDMLKTTGKCCIIRPTGYGKTGILTKVLKNQSNRYKHVLYLYPTKVILDTVLNFYYDNNIPDDRTIPNCTFMTYAKLARIKDESIPKIEPPDLIIIDECHLAGARKTMLNLDVLLSHFSDADLLGATATPDRMDLIDAIGRYFNDNLVSEYNLHDSFQDKLLKKPYYFYCNYADPEEQETDIRSLADAEIDKIDSERDKLILRKNLEQKLIEISNLYNMPNVIRRGCDEYAKTTQYMKFICFFHSFNDIRQNGNKVLEWFRKAYPDHKTTATTITSENKVNRENLNKLQSMHYEPNVIELIFCCNMLNLGYHVNDLTGIVMYRGTKSGIIYVQQLGRALSSGAMHPCIVFDIVDNLHQKSLYQVLGHESVATTRAKNRKKQLENKRKLWNRYLEWQKTGNASAANKKKFVDPNWVKTNEFTKHDASELTSLTKRFKKGTVAPRVNELEPQDLIAIDIEATYRELIAKTVAEAKSMRCRQAYISWLETRAYEHCPTDKNGRPFTRAEILAMQSPNDIPLAPFCYLKQVSIDAVLDEMGIT